MIDLSRYSFLLVDDFIYSIEKNSEEIVGEGAKVEQAFDGKQALEKFESSTAGYFDVILTDIEMPVMDGKEMARQIRNLNRLDAKSIIIIALTQHSIQQEIYESIRAGIDAHITKPLNLNELEKVIQFIEEARKK